VEEVPPLDRGGSSVCQDAELRNPSWAVIKSPTELFCRGGENDLLREHGDFMKCRSIAVSNGGADLDMVREGRIEMKLALSRAEESQCTFQEGNSKYKPLPACRRGLSIESDSFAGAMVRLAGVS
jgi:hypothetical protein